MNNRDKGKKAKQQLIKSAIELYAKHGIHNVSTRQIASYANTNIASISYYFLGKEGLFDACIQYMSEQALKKHQPLRQKIELLIEDNCEDKNIWRNVLKEHINYAISFFLSDKFKKKFQLFLMLEANDSKSVEEYFREVWWPVRDELIKIIGKLSDNQSIDIIEMKFLSIIGMTRALISRKHYVLKSKAREYFSHEFIEKYVDYIIKSVETL